MMREKSGTEGGRENFQDRLRSLQLIQAVMDASTKT